MMTHLAALATFSIVAMVAAQPAAADPRYYNAGGPASGCYILSICLVCPDGTLQQCLLCEQSHGEFGASYIACFEGDHIQPDPLVGVATITMVDELGGAVAGFACQDSNNNSICGEGGDLAENFCGSTELGDLDGWAPQDPLFVFPQWAPGYQADPVSADPLLCGQATKGRVDHS